MSSSRNTLVRSLHDVGAAGWFGGALMGAVALNGASKVVSDPFERSKVAASGWARWAPFSAVAIGAHLLGGAGLLLAHRDRVRSQSGVGANTAVKTMLTAAALGTTAYSGLLGAKLGKAGDVYTERRNCARRRHPRGCRRDPAAAPASAMGHPRAHRDTHCARCTAGRAAAARPGAPQLA